MRPPQVVIVRESFEASPVVRKRRAQKGLLDALTLPHFYASGLIELQVGGALLALVPNP